MSTDVAAQDWLFAGATSILANKSFGTVVPPPIPIYGAPVIGGGRYAVRGTDAIDIMTGATFSVGPGFAVAFDAARPRVYVARTDGIWVVDVQYRLNYMLSPGPTSEIASCEFATSTETLVCVMIRAADRHEIVRIDGAGRHVLLTTQAYLERTGRPWVLSSDASRFYFQRCTPVALPLGTTCNVDLAMLDLTTGALRTIPAAALPLGFVGAMAWDELNERLLLSVGANAQAVTKDLGVIGSAFIGGDCHAFAVSPHTGRLYVVRSSNFQTPASAFVLDSVTYRTLEPTVTFPPGSGVFCSPVRVLTAPGPPRDLRASVTGRGNVQIAWTNVGGAGGFVLDVGFAPGRTDLQVFLGAESQTSFANVPPGTYYLRLRGGNLFGGGRPSQELQVVVP